jgi:Xaa-Pro aminopeptidase
MNSCAIAQRFRQLLVQETMLMYCTIENNQQCKSGDLILIDAGAEYANYSSDMTRTIPVSGKYNDRQKAVYNAVLRVKMKLLKCCPRNTLETVPSK